MPAPRASAPREEPVVTTTSAERYVMGGGRASRLAIKEGDLFLYTNELGQVPGTENSALGLYYRDTRYLSRYELTIAGRQPVLLSASADRGYAATVELTNLEARTADGHVLPQASVHVRRTRFVSDRLYELLRVQNYHQREVELVVDLHFDADFADLFEVRGSRRRRRGSRLAPKAGDGSLTLSYLGLDEVTRQTIVRFHDRPESIKQGRARFRLHLPPGEARRAALRRAGGRPGGAGRGRRRVQRAHRRAPPRARALGVGRHRHLHRQRAAQPGAAPRPAGPAHALHRDRRRPRAARRRCRGSSRRSAARWRSSGSRRCCWTCAGRGRRSSFLARRQGTADNAFREEQPGKIMHELRRGELAAIRAVPHTPYFGSVDATALWLLLVAELAVWTGDLDGFELRAPAVDAALAWIDGPGDPDGDGFVEYERRSRVGLRNQGWRDSQDAVVHDDGTPAEGPIALAETQGYVYYAKRRLAAVYGQLGDVERAERLAQSAARLKRAFNERFWMEDEGFFAMALDGQKRQVGAVSSTVGHALWSRIVAEEHIPDVVRRLMAPDMFTGWGIRTLSKDARFYNPVSFYNGSVWPFDTALIANGLKKHGYVQEADRLAWGLLEAAAAHEYSRLPEMFCGFTRHAVDRPVSFPMACSPDSNSAAALFLVLQSMLGIYAQAEENIVYVHNPVLPRWLGEVTLSNLRVGRTTMRLRFRREGGQTSFSVLDKQGPGRIVVVE